ncbi:MAG TPA: hypothetical protein VK530_01065 [Candidatus Acidoferrum sp.]|nr:hypothetical protein [Candidatus Acidoferrum sp.]
MYDNGFLAFEQKVTVMLVGPFVDDIEHTQGHEMMLTHQRLEFDTSPSIASNKTQCDGMELHVE